MKSIRFVFVVLLLTTLPFIIIAKDDSTHPLPNPPDFSKISTLHSYKRVSIPPELDEWIQKNVVPVLLTWKAEFDKKLNKNDLAKLNTLRKKAKCIDSVHNIITKQLSAAQSQHNIDAYLQAYYKLDSLQNAIFNIQQQLNTIVYSRQNAKTIEAITLKARFQYSLWDEQLKMEFKTFTLLHSDTKLTYEDIKESALEKYSPFGLRSHIHGKYLGELFLLSDNFYYWDGTFPTTNK